MQQPEEQSGDAAENDYERWDWGALRSEGFWPFVLYRRILLLGVPTAVFGFLLLAWLWEVPMVDVIAGRRPGFSFLVKAFFAAIGVTILVTGVFAVHEWNARERRRAEMSD